MKVAGIGGSDTHQRFAAAAGYWRTWVRVPDDAAERIAPSQVSAGVNALAATVSNGPFVQLTAQRVKGGTRVGLPVGIGETVPSGEGDLEVTVDVQLPDYMDLTRVELYLHRPEDDASCPIDPVSPEAKTTRVACNGETNVNWPQSGVAATQAVTLGPADREDAVTVGTETWQRLRKRVTFLVPAPKTDNWIVAMVYGSKPLFPLVYPNKLAGGGAKPVAPFGFTNPVFVDADGNGYDHPPFNPPPRQGPPAPVEPRPRRLPRPEEMLETLRRIAE
jgi:hypothetical protein